MFARWKKLGLTELKVPVEYLINKVIAEAIVDKTTGEILAQGGPGHYPGLIYSIEKSRH